MLPNRSISSAARLFVVALVVVISACGGQPDEQAEAPVSSAASASVAEPQPTATSPRAPTLIPVTPVPSMSDTKDISTPTTLPEPPVGPTANIRRALIDFTPGDPNRQLDVPYPIPDTCPVSPTIYGERAGYPAFWTQGDGVWAGLRTIYTGGSKVLWITDGPQIPIIEATPIDQKQGEFDVSYSQALESPAWHPSSLTFSTSGCWSLDVTSGDDWVELVVYVFPNQYAYRLIDDQFMTITAVQFPTIWDGQQPIAGQQFVSIEFWMESAVGDRSVSPWTLLAPLTLQDANGARYPLVEAAGVDGGPLAEALPDVMLEPREDLRVVVVFSVPDSPLGMDLIITSPDGEVIDVPITHLTGK